MFASCSENNEVEFGFCVAFTSGGHAIVELPFSSFFICSRLVAISCDHFVLVLGGQM